jgi:hypothetical protein
MAPELARHDPATGPILRAEAAEMERRATQLLTLPSTVTAGAGGELTLPKALAGELPGIAGAIDSEPDAVIAEASLRRAELAGDAGCLSLALDATQGQATTNIEKMLAHQLAAAHTHGMTLIARAMKERDPVETARLTNAAARMLETFRQGALALDHLHNGRRQTVVVQHVHVSGDGKAVVAGAVNPALPGVTGGGGAS